MPRTTKKPGNLQPSPTKIADLRFKMGWTVAEMSMNTGVSQASIYAIEGGRVPTITTLRKVADGCGKRVQTLLERAA